MYRKTDLENGIRVVTETMPEVRSVSLGLLVDAGPANDPAGREGLAHLAEHLMFQGTSSRSAMQIARLMDAGGGHMGGFTTRDYTCYFGTVLDDYVTYALDLFGDIFLNSHFPEEGLAREKEAILREIAAGDDSPYEQVHHLLKQQVWPDHPLGQPITGRPETVAELSREDVIYFVHEHYTPDRIIVAAAGNLVHEDFVAQVRDAFWRMLGHSEPLLPAVPQYHAGVAIEHRALSQAYFSISIPAFNYCYPDRYSLHLLNNILGGGISSRLFRKLREAHGLVYDIGSAYHAYREGGLLVIEGSTSPEGLIPVLGVTLLEMALLLSSQQPVGEEELLKAKMQIRGQHLIGGEDTNTRMSRLATQTLYFDQHIPADDILAQIDQVDVQMLANVGERLLDGLAQTAVAVVGPERPQQVDKRAVEAVLADFQ